MSDDETIHKSHATARRMAELGFPIFPIARGKKVPDGRLAPNGKDNATADPETLEGWIKTAAVRNYGIRLDGLFVLDLDKGSTWPKDEDRKAELAEKAGAIAKTPSGAHYYFRRPESLGTLGQLVGGIAEAVDIKTGFGDYAVLPGSTFHGEKDKPAGDYEWVEGCELDKPADQLAEPPAWLLEAYLAAKHPKAGPSQAKTGEGSIVRKGRRNKTLASLAGTMRKTGMGFPAIFAALFEENKNFDPPLEEAEVRRVAESISKYAPDEAWVAVTRGDFADQAVFGYVDNMVKPGPGPDVDLVRKATTKKPIPAEVVGSIRPGGILDLFMQEVARGERFQQPVFRFAAGLALFSAILGRKVRLKDGLLASLYMVLIAPTGEGKDRCRKVLVNVLNRTDEKPKDDEPVESIVARMPHSDSGAFALLVTRPDRILVHDEFGELLACGKMAANANLPRLMAFLTEAFTVGAGPINQPRYATDRTVGCSPPIWAPFFTLVGLTTPGNYFDALRISDVENGNLGRFLVFEGEAEPKKNKPGDQDLVEINPELLRQVSEWRSFRPQVGDDISEVVEGRTDMAVWTVDPEAEIVFDACGDGWLEEKRRLQSQGRPEAGLFVRGAEIAKRVAMVLAADQLEGPAQENAITAKEAALACDLVDWSIRSMVRETSNRITVTDIGKAGKLILAFLAKKAGEGKPWQKLNDIITGCRSRCLEAADERNKILNDLVTNRHFVDMRTEKGGNHREVKFFRITDLGAASISQP